MKMWNKLSKKAKQKIWGIAAVIISALSISIDGNAIGAVLGIPLGLWLIFTNKNIMFYEEGDEELL